MTPTVAPNGNTAGSGAGRYRGGIIGMMGGDPNQTLLETLYQAYQKHQQNNQDQQLNAGMDRNAVTSDPNQGAGPTGTAGPSAPVPNNPGNDGAEPFAKGGVVTQPTRAILGENGPEAVIPLTDQPGAHLSTNMLGAVHSRYRRPTGPNALKHDAPIKADVPLLPNKGVR
jgi:hypothetical protein